MMLYEKHTLIFTVQRAVAASADPIYADVDRSNVSELRRFFQMYNEREKELRHGLLLFESEQVTLKIDTVRDIFTHRHILKQSRFNIETLNHLAVLIRDGLKAKARFRVFESLRVLRAQVLSASERLPNHTVKILFEIYQHLILESREEVQWCLSR